MLSLVKIRIKYIIRHPLLLFFTYILIPAVIMIAGIYVISDKSPKELETYEKVVFKDFNQRFSNDSYPTLKDKYYLNFTAFIADSEETCKKIENILISKNIKLIKDKNISYTICSTTESKLDNITVNIIKIQKNDDKYKVDLRCGGGNTTEFINKYFHTDFYKGIINYLDIHDKPFIDNLDHFTFYLREDLDGNVITDAFYASKEDYSKKIDKLKIFFELQSLISSILIELEGKSSQASKDFTMKFGYNKYPDSYRVNDAGEYLGPCAISLLATLEFALICYNVNMRMIDEKEHKLNILLERQGISKFKYMLSWFFTHFSVSLISIVAFSLLLAGVTYKHAYLSVINIILYDFSLFSVCVFFSVCIKTVKTGATAIKFYNFCSLFLGFVLVSPETLKVTKVVFSFIPHVNFFNVYYTTFCLGDFENLNFELLFLRAAKTGYFEGIMMYVVDSIFYFGLAIFIQSYKDSGLSFCSYMLSFCKKVSRNADILRPINQVEILKGEEEPLYEKHFQELSQLNKQKLDQNQCLKLVNVSKSFDEVKAVKCFNGELFSNEIFCLLGHNGAGKTTTISMISGIYDPDEGDIYLNGRSLVTDKKYLYQNIGLCQQEDIFFDYLTVEEHLAYMSQIKGSQINRQEIEELITKIDLLPKKKSLCSTLSGGQKRKLCIALALIGNSRIVLLDEPTSGMDVMARRSLWEFLKNYKKDKIILLTTHFLDEAEYLGDRIGIMTDGEYICCGSSSFLKSKYPCGFNINLLVNSDIFNENYKVQLFNEILKYEPKAEIKVASKGIFSINILPNNKNINQIFDYIENSKKDFGIEDFTVASTSLEDVFLKLNNKATFGDQKYSEKKEFSDELNNFMPRKTNFCVQLCAEICRSFYPLIRNKTLFFFELLSGVGFVYVYILFFSDTFTGFWKKTLNNIEVLNAHKIYINGIDKEFFKNSDVYNTYGTYITLSQFDDSSNDIEEFMDNAYKNSFVNIAKGSLCVKKEQGKSNYEVYNTETSNGLYGYLYANTMLFFSAFLQKEYDIKATIFYEMVYNPFSANVGSIISDLMGMYSLLAVCIINFFGLVLFLGGLMLEKIKEKRTNIKHLLYLSGSNIFSYWVGFFIVDYIKLAIFAVLLIIPIYKVSNVATFFGLDMLIINLSSLSFIYFISFFCSKDDEGAKILFLFVIGFIIVVILYFVVWRPDSEDIFPLLFDAYKPTIFDFTPVTSMVLSFIRLMASFTLFEEFDKFNEGEKQDDIGGLKRPEVYLLTSFISQIINVVVYTLLLAFAESGLLGKLIHAMEIGMYGENDLKTAPLAPIAPKISDNINNTIEDYSINNVESPLINNAQKSIPLSNSNVINTSSNQYKMNAYPNQYNPNQYNLNQYNNNQYNLNQYNQVQNFQNQYNQVQNASNYHQSLDFNFNGENLKGDPLQNPYVLQEIQKVYSEKELSSRVINVTKTFYPCCACCRRGKVRAINHLHLGLEPNEKFGLLGFNGSGKTTTFRAITNEILFDSGSINLFGYDTKKQFDQIRTIIGYCPQINPLFDFMRVRELIHFYSKLKTCNETPEEICEKFGLKKYINTYTINLSGGNKRKLTFAIAMMNKPTLLLLDEPSTGVDPESRRVMWRNINELSNSGHKYNMILTTHSMEEAEILCDTVSWFKAGNFITLGNPEKLKIKFSAGYKMHIKFDSNKLAYQNINDINKTFEQICTMVDGFNKPVVSKFILSNQNFEPYLISLMHVVQKIRDKVKKISLYLIGKDYSFELVIQIINDKKKDLFCEILNLKNTDDTVDELTISMQSLENILTALD